MSTSIIVAPSQPHPTSPHPLPDEIGDQMMPPPMFTPPGAGNLSPFTVPANTVDHNYPPITSNASLMANPTRVILLRVSAPLGIRCTINTAVCTRVCVCVWVCVRVGVY